MFPILHIFQGSCNNCKCTPKQFDGPAGLPIGNCLAKDPSNQEYYCYVGQNSGCNDKKLSTREPNLYSSYKACECQRAEGIFAADYAYEQDEDYENYENYNYENYE